MGRFHVVGTPGRVSHNKLEAGEVADSTPGRVGYSILAAGEVADGTLGTLKAGEAM